MESCHIICWKVKSGCLWSKKYSKCNGKVNHYLEGDCESRYGEVATLTEQICPRNCHRQVLQMEIVKVTFLQRTKTWMYPSTNSTGKSASSIRQLMVRMLRATLLRDIAPSTESWMQSKIRNKNKNFFGCTWSRDIVSSRNVPKYLLMRYRPANIVCIFLGSIESS